MIRNFLRLRWLVEKLGRMALRFLRLRLVGDLLFRDGLPWPVAAVVGGPAARSVVALQQLRALASIGQLVGSMA